MSILKTMAVRSVEEATRSIPVIDVSRAYRDEPGALDTVAREVRHASEHVGFFCDLVLEFYNANYLHRQGHATEGAR